MVADHHLGMIELAHAAIERKDATSEAQAKAHETERTLDRETKELTSMLAAEFGTSYAPRVTPDNERMIERVRNADGAGVDRLFYQAVVEHHARGVQMIDEHLSRLEQPRVRHMAERMKADQEQQTSELQRKL